MLKKLEDLDGDFRTHYFSLIDLVEDEETLETEQVTLDTHDDDLSTLLVCIKRLIDVHTSCSDDGPRKLLSRRLSHLRKGLTSVGEEIRKMGAEPGDTCLIRQRQEQLTELKEELGDVSKTLLSLDLDDGDELVELQSALSGDVFNHSLKLKRMLSAIEFATSSTPSSTPTVRVSSYRRSTSPFSTATS
jgi:hypothetical protein